MTIKVAVVALAAATLEVTEALTMVEEISETLAHRPTSATEASEEMTAAVEVSTAGSIKWWAVEWMEADEVVSMAAAAEVVRCVVVQGEIETADQDRMVAVVVWEVAAVEWEVWSFKDEPKFYI